MRRIALTSAMAAVVLALVGSARGLGPSAERGDFDAESGASRANYPPHRTADILHIALDVTIPEMNRREMSVVQRIRLKPLGGELAELTLNQAGLDIRSAKVGEEEADFEVDNDAETVTFLFATPLAAGRESTITLEYRVSEPSDGVFWTTETGGVGGAAGRPAQLHTQGQPESARCWFVCHDFPNERQTTEITATVPAGFTAVSNGRLESQTASVGGGLTTFRWVQDRAHVSYLVSLVVGRFESVDVARGGKIAMPVYVPVGRGTDVPGTFGRTAEMVGLYERLFDEPYPWAQYAQVVVDNFAWGGMENTGATTLYHHAVMSERERADATSEDLIAHELVHQWFGNLVTCASWEHAWLNEAFATLGEALWWEFGAGGRGAAADGDGGGGGVTAGLARNLDAYQWWLLGMRGGLLESDHAAAPAALGMATKVYAHANDVFEQDANPYTKGAWVLHMLRRRLGDEAFFRGVAGYLDAHADRSVETFEFRRAMERAGGVSLARFFDQWVVRPGTPKVGVEVAWDAEASRLRLRAEQRQPIDGANPAFAFELPVKVLVAGESTWREVRLAMDGRSAEAEVALPGEPSVVAVDPDLDVLADVEVEQDAGRWIVQLREGPTYAARVQAAGHLAKATGLPDGAASAALAKVVLDAGAHHGLRSAAARALADRATGQGKTDGPRDASALDEVMALSGTAIEEPRTRAAVADAIGRAGDGAEDAAVRGRAVDVLTAWATGDAASGVRAAAIASLGRLRAAEKVDVFRAALATRTHDARVERAALGAMADLDSPAVVEDVLRATGAGFDPFARAKAADSLARLARHDREKVFATLSALLDDGEQRVALAAGEAMSGLDDRRVGEVLERRSRLARARFDRHMAGVWLRAWEGRGKK